ncbi:MAG: hypothetical protein IKI70_01420 [Bacteroidales bacterium]|nr:hypothetical protein [Bacteroidales bacterium]
MPVSASISTVKPWIHGYKEVDDYYELMADNSQDVEDKIVTTQHLIDVERTNYPDKYPGKVNQIVSLML